MLELLHNAGRLICGQVHPLDDGSMMPLCARCSGLYLSFAVTMIVAALGVMTGGKKDGRDRLIMAIALTSAAPIHALFFPYSDSLGRFASGAMTGAGIAMMVGGSVLAGLLAITVLIGLAETRSAPVFLFFAYASAPAVLLAALLPLARILHSIFDMDTNSILSSYRPYRHRAPGAGHEIMVPHGE